MVGGRSARRRNARMRQYALQSENDGDGRDGSGAAAAGADGANSDGSIPPPPPSIPMPFSRRGRRGRRGMAAGGETGSMLPKLMMKMVVYGVVMMAMKYAKKKDVDGGVDAPANEPPWFIERIGSILGLSFGRDSSGALLPGTKTLRVGTGKKNDDTAATVYVVPNFLPKDTATRWKEGAAYEWERGAKKEANTAFQFSSIPSTSSEDSIEAMNSAAQLARTEGKYSMARWELDSPHPLVAEVGRTLDGNDTRNKLVALGMEKDSAILEEATVTYYSLGDFLLNPGGGYEDKIRWTVIVSLTDDTSQTTTPDDEGSDKEPPTVATIRFACAPTQTKDDGIAEEWCDTVQLSFNSAIVFSSSKENAPKYEVMPHEYDDYARGSRHYGVVGSYMQAGIDATTTKEPIREDKEL